MLSIAVFNYPQKNERLCLSDAVLALCDADHRKLVSARAFAQYDSYLRTYIARNNKQIVIESPYRLATQLCLSRSLYIHRVSKNIPDIIDCRIIRFVIIFGKNILTQLAVRRQSKFPPHPTSASVGLLPGRNVGVMFFETECILLRIGGPDCNAIRRRWCFESRAARYWLSAIGLAAECVLLIGAAGAAWRLAASR